MRQINTADAVGHVLCHDITRIIRGVEKCVAFKKGHVVTQEDIPALLELGKEHLYVWEMQEGMLHENDAAEILYRICAGDHMRPTEVKEGKIEVIADSDGLLTVDIERLRAVNELCDMIIATRHSHFPVKRGDHLAGTRVTPLIIENEKMERAQEISGGKPLLELLPFAPKKVGVVTTGSEVFYGRIKDSFTPVIRDKLAEYNSDIFTHEILSDSPEDITNAILKMIDAGAEMVICTGGMSVDPDDRTPLAIKNTGANIVSYGAPVLPGAMFLLSYYEMDGRADVPVLGLPGCVMYAKRTIFDLILARLMAGLRVSARDLAGLGHGGLCLNCEACTYPNCGFGKGV